MQFELGVALASHGHQSGVVWARADLGEIDVVALDEQFDAEHSPAAQCAGHGRRDLTRPNQRRVAHGLRLPRFDVVAGTLQVPIGSQKNVSTSPDSPTARTVSWVIS